MESPRTEEARKHQAALGELAQMKDVQPKLCVHVFGISSPEDSKGPVTFRLSRTAGLLDPDRAVEEERSKHFLPGRSALARAFLLQLTERQRRRYNEDLERYFEDYREWIDAKSEFRRQTGPAVVFGIRVENAGRSPARDVDVRLCLPSLFRFVACGEEHDGDLPRLPEQPKPPTLPAPQLPRLASSVLESTLAMPSPVTPKFPAEKWVQAIGSPTLSIDRNQRGEFVVHVRIPKLMHHDSFTTDDVFAVFRSWDDAKPFEASARLIAENVPDPIEATVPFIVEVVD